MSETIVIREQSEQTGKRGKFLKLIASDDEWYFVFDSKLFSAIKGRTSILADVDRSGQFKRITAVIPAEQTTLPETNGKAQPFSHETKDEQIARAVALKAAVDQSIAFTITDASHKTREEIATWTTGLADAYLLWLQGPPF